MQTNKLKRPIKVMIVDDSAIARVILRKILSEDEEITIVSAASSALMALDNMMSVLPDIILLDIEMPGISGLEAIPKFVTLVPKAKIIMVSTLTKKNASITMEGLALGAADYIEKPTALANGSVEDFKKNLINKIKIIAQNILSPISGNESSSTIYQEEDGHIVKLLDHKEIKLRNDRELNFKPEILAIASSTGGPKAVTELLKSFDQTYLQTIPIVITQHMPPMFTKLFAENIDKLSIIKCYEAKDKQIVLPGEMYVAPGGSHMLLRKEDNKIKIVLEDGEPIAFCKPSADPMLSSIAEIYGNKALAVVLTGMGHDGFEGAKKIVDCGGVVLAQDKETSIVWGMPGTVAVNNICSAVLPLKEIGPYIMQRGG